MDRKNLQQRLLGMFRSSGSSRKNASQTPKARKLGMESLEARQLLSATPLESSAALEEPLAVYATSVQDSVATVCPGCSLIAPEQGAPAVEEISSFTNMMDELIRADGQDPYNLSQDYVFNLSSNPSSTYTIYLDFNGNVAKNTYWNDGKDVVTPAYDTDGNLSSFSNSELRDIYEAWLRVSEDYMPFNVNVTTKEPTADQLIKSSSGDKEYGIHVAIGGSCYDWYNSSCGGVAYVGSYTWNSDTPAFVFPKQLYSAKNVAEAAAHEVGHTLGLGHDGTSTQGYYGGADDWAPIMGVGYSQNLTQWSKGEYPDANNHQDDLEQITSNGFDYRRDDHGDKFSDATKLTFASTGKIGAGIIERNTDVDFFKFTLAGEQSVITVGGITAVTNLDVKVEIYDSNKNIVGTYDPTNTYYVKVDVSGFEPGDYYMTVTGTGMTIDGQTIYTDYASLGAYTIETELSTESADPYEPNETQVGAYRLGVISEPTTITAMIDPRSDNDYFNFTLGAGYTGVKITVDYDYSQSSAVLKTRFNNGEEWKATFTDGSKLYYALDSNDSLYFHVSASTYRNAIPYRVTITPLESPELTSLALSSTKAKVGLPISAVLPYEGLTASFQWYRGTNDDDMVAIPGATGQTYVPTNDDLGYALKVVATGYGNCYGTASATSDKVAAQTVWTVGSTADTASSSPLTLRQALASAAAGDRIVFDTSLSGKTISVGSTLLVDKAITIDASALEAGIILDGGGAQRIMAANESCGYLCVKGLTFANAYAQNSGAALLFDGDLLDVDSCTFTGSVVASDSEVALGGALSIFWGEANVVNSTFVNNKLTSAVSVSGGAAIGASGSSYLSISRSTFDGNTSNRLAGAVYALGTLDVDASSFTNNTAENVGGAIAAYGESILANTLLAGNKAGAYGGGLYADNNFWAHNCTVADNTATYYGAGMYIAAGSGHIYNSVLVQNSAQRASGADVEKDSGASLYGFSNLTNYTKWTASLGNIAYSATKPLFTDSANGDYSLPANSQAVDVGANEYVVTTRDITGNTRVYNSIVDIGAYEYMLAPKANLLFTPKLGWEEAVVVSADPDAKASDRSFKIGENYSLKFNFANESNVDVAASFVARVYLDGAVVKTFSFQGLKADAAADAALDLGALEAGEHSLKIVLDPGDTVDESNENDNVYETTLEVLDDDEFEPNDTLQDATDLGVLLNATVVNAKAGVKQNEDWFRFSIAALGSADSYLRLNFDAAEGAAELTATLFDANGNMLAESVPRAIGVEEISLNALTAGAYYVRVFNKVDAPSVRYALTIDPPEPPKADLTQITPAGWDAPIVVNDSPDATTQADAYYEGVEYYANFNITNASPSPTKETFYVSAYLDDVLLSTYTVKGLGAHAIKSYDLSLGTLTVGSHMVKIVVDTTDAVEEASETNNTFTQTFNVLGVDDKYEPNDTMATAYNLGALIEEQNLKLYAGSSQNEDWFRFSLPEAGTSAGRVVLTYKHVSDLADVDLYLYDAAGNQLAYSNRATGTEMISLNGLAAGVYYVKAFNCCDVENSVPYEMTFYPATVAKPNLKETALSTWNASILVANSASSSTDAPVCFEGMNYYVRFAFTNDSSCAIENAFTVKCYVDDVLAKTYEVESMFIGANKSFSFSLGALDMGVHTIRVELDTNNTVDESNELDNVYAKTIFVVSGEDDYEPNDTLKTAYDLGTLAGISKYSLNAEREQDEDWFKFTTVSAGEEGDCVSLTYAHVSSSADVDLYLYDENGSLLGSSRLNTGVETISLAGLPVGTYYIKTLNYFDKPTTVPYELTIAAPVYKTETPTLEVVATTPLDAVATIGAVDDAVLYTLEYSTSFDFAESVVVEYAQAGEKAISGLQDGMTYYFRVKASSELPDSVWSDVVTIETEKMEQLDAPVVEAVATGYTSIAVTVGEVAGAEAYKIEYATNEAFENSTTVQGVVGVNDLVNLEIGATYYVRVIATAQYSLDSEPATATASTWNAVQLDAPVVTANTTKTALVLNIKAVENAANYLVQYSEDPTFATYSERSYPAGVRTITKLDSNVVYYYRVKAVAPGFVESTEYVDSEWTEGSARTKSAFLAAPVVVAEAKGATAIDVTIEAVADATGYVCEYATSEDFSDAQRFTTKKAGATSIYGLDPETTYYVRAYATANGYAKSDYGTASATTEGAVELDVPTFKTVATKTAIVFIIDSVENAESYRVQYSLDPSFATYTERTFAAGTRTIASLDSATTYYCRVKSVAPLGGVYVDSEWVDVAVETKAVYLAAPEIQAAASGVDSIDLTISAVPSATSYTYEYSLTEDFADATSATITAPGVVTISGLDSGTTYYFRAKASAAKYDDSEYGYASETTDYDVVLDAPVVRTAVTKSAVVLYIDAVENGEKYVVEYSVDPNFETYGTKTYNAGCRTITKLDPDTTYYFRVKATAEKYFDSEWTELSATTKTNVLETPKVALESDGGDVVLTIAKTDVACSFAVEVAATDDFANPTCLEFESAGSYALTGLQLGEGAFVRVRAFADGYVDSQWNCAYFDGLVVDGSRYAAPTISAIANSKYCVNVGVGAVRNAASYSIQISNDCRFDRAATYQVEPGVTAVDWLSPNTLYFFRAKATLENGRDTQWSSSVFATTFADSRFDSIVAEEEMNDDELLEVLAESILD